MNMLGITLKRNNAFVHLIQSFLPTVLEFLQRSTTNSELYLYSPYHFPIFF